MNTSKLRDMRANHRAAVEVARQDGSTEMLWLVVGSLSAVLDAVLTELIEEGDKELIEEGGDA